MRERGICHYGDVEEAPDEAFLPEMGPENQAEPPVEIEEDQAEPHAEPKDGADDWQSPMLILKHYFVRCPNLHPLGFCFLSEGIGGMASDRCI